MECKGGGGGRGAMVFLTFDLEYLVATLKLITFGTSTFLS